MPSERDVEVVLETAPGRGEAKFSRSCSPTTAACQCAICLLKGDEALSDYQFGSNSMHHLFCRHCGVRPFGRGHLDLLGGDFYSINVACLDGVDDAERAALPVRFMDGRHNNWSAPPAETRHL